MTPPKKGHLTYSTSCYMCKHNIKTYMLSYTCRVGQNHIYTVHIRYFWQGNYQIYGHIRCTYTVLANPIHVQNNRPSRLSASGLPCLFCTKPLQRPLLYPMLCMTTWSKFSKPQNTATQLHMCRQVGKTHTKTPTWAQTGASHNTATPTCAYTAALLPCRQCRM